MTTSKNVLLINPWIYDFAAYDFWLKPLGLLALAGIVERHSRCRVRLIDCLGRSGREPAGGRPVKADGRGPFPKEEVPKPAVLRGIPRRYSRYGIPVAEFREALAATPVPDLVLLTGVMTYWYPGVQAAIDLVREKFGRVPIVLGGAYPTLAPGHALAHSGADRIVRGPGENRVLPLIREILGDGIAEAVEFPSLDDWPAPSFDLAADRTWLPVLTSRGCPLRCSFCASRLLTPAFEQRDPAMVVGEILASASRFGTKHFVFYDDALLINKAVHIVPILEGVLAAGPAVSFHAPNGLHVREIDEDLARLLRRADVRSIYLSQESMDETLLGERAPKVAPGDLARAMACLEKAGYRRDGIHVYLIVGLPGQGGEAVREAVVRVRELGAIPRLAHFSPIPGTDDWRRLVDAGALSEDADPLLHNKTVGPYLWGGLTPAEIAEVRELMIS
jgi:radical SAM superfamily enzyme YgiQ (UPF0313 family)